MRGRVGRADPDLGCGAGVGGEPGELSVVQCGCLAAASEVGCVEIEVDLRSLRFCGGAGLEAFRDAQHECAVNGGLLLLCNPQRSVLRALNLVGLQGLLTDWRT